MQTPSPQAIETKIKFGLQVSCCARLPKGLRQKAFEMVRKLHTQRDQATVTQMERGIYQ